MPRFEKLTIDRPEALRFGVAPKPLTTRRGMVIGGGTVYPELNFTLPAINVDSGTMPQILRQYGQIIGGATARAVELE